MLIAMDVPISNKTDFSALAEILFPFAQECLQEFHTFLPFGAFINKKGKGEFIAFEADDSLPDPEAELVMRLSEHFRERARKKGYRAVGFCEDVRTTFVGTSDPTDAIHVGLEHASGEGVNIFLPYRRDEVGHYYFAATFATPRETGFFEPPVP